MIRSLLFHHKTWGSLFRTSRGTHRSSLQLSLALLGNTGRVGWYGIFRRYPPVINMRWNGFTSRHFDHSLEFSELIDLIFLFHSVVYDLPRLVFQYFFIIPWVVILLLVCIQEFFNPINLLTFILKVMLEYLFFFLVLIQIWFNPMNFLIHRSFFSLTYS